VAEGKSCMWIRYRVLQAGIALLVALTSVALGCAWAWGQQESNPAARQSGNCPGADELGTIGPTGRNLDVGFRVEGKKFRLIYKTTDLDEDGVPLLDVTVLDKDKDEVGGRVIRDQGTESEIVSEGSGRFTMEIRAEDLRYEITVEDCTGEDQSATGDQYGGGGGGGVNVDDTPGPEGSLGLENNTGIADNVGLGDGLGLGDDPGFGTGVGQDADIPEDVIADTIPDRNTLPFTGGPPLFGLALIGLACTGLGIAVLRSAIRRP
jgi:hypothetical protein